MMIRADNTITTRFEVLRGGGVFATLEPYGAPEIECVTSSALKMALRGTFLAQEKVRETGEETEGERYTATVTTPTGAAYGFKRNAAGWYESTNAGVQNSAAVCRLDLSGTKAWTLTLECTSEGESGFDFGVVYKLDQVPELTTDVGKSFLCQADNNTFKFTVDVPEGEHFMYFKYRKDGSTDTGSDRMAFRILDMPESVIPNTPNINWLTDRIRPVLILNGTEYTMGVYLVTTAEEQWSDMGKLLTIEGYSVLYLASRTLLETAMYRAAGTSYLAVVQELLQTAGVTNYIADTSEYTLATDREWEMGTPVLDIVNALLAEINYNTAWPDADGAVRLTKYTAPGQDNILHTYTAGEYSILFSGTAASTDYFGKANVFKCVCSSPDLAAPLTAMAENNLADSPFSIAKMGRILHLEYVDNVPNQEALQERAENLLTKSLQTTEEIVFSTALEPGHGTFDTIAFDNGDITGIFTETEWRMTLDASGTMTHKARRVIFA